MYPYKAFSTSQIDVFYFSPDTAIELQKYLIRNKERLAPFEPSRDASYYELDIIKERINLAIDNGKSNKDVSFIIRENKSKKIIGVINFTNFVFGVFQACYLWFSIDRDYEGRKMMYEALSSAIENIRDKYKIHRIMANHLPENLRSEALLNRLGFIKEGYAKSYLKINGKWQDHVLNSLVFEE